MSVTAVLPVPQCFAERREAVFAPVDGQSPLVRIVASLSSVGDVVVGVSAPLVEPVSDVLAAQGFSSVRVMTADAPGGRAQCIAAGLRGLAHGPHGPVLLHDMAWPLIASSLVDRVVAALRGGAVAVLPTCPVTDSIKAVDARGAVTATVDRAPLRTVQYPRGFDAAALAQLMSGASDGFDELEAVLSGGGAVTFVDGDNETTLVELPADAGYLAAIIESRRDPPGR